MASSIKLLVMFFDKLVDTAMSIITNHVETIGGIILTVLVIYAIKGFLAMLGD